MAIQDIDIFDNDDLVVNGAITGFTKIDKHLGAALPYGVINLQGAAGCGKTALALQIATQCKQSAFYVSCEMSNGAILQRLIARLGKVKMSEMANKSIASDKLQAAKQFTVQNTPFVHLENGVNGFVSLDLIRDTVKKIKAQDGSNTVLIIIDSATDWILKGAKSEGSTPVDFAKKIALELNDFAKEEEFTVLAILQKSDDAQTKQINEKFEFIAEVALELKWERDGRELGGKKTANFKIVKNRKGSLGTEILTFVGEHQEFTE